MNSHSTVKKHPQHRFGYRNITVYVLRTGQICAYLHGDLEERDEVRLVGVELLAVAAVAHEHHRLDDTVAEGEPIAQQEEGDDREQHERHAAVAQRVGEFRLKHVRRRSKSDFSLCVGGSSSGRARAGGRPEIVVPVVRKDSGGQKVHESRKDI